MFANELVRLAQGVGRRLQVTDLIFFVAYNKIPPDRWKDGTYIRIVCDYCPQKEEPHQMILTVGGGGLID